MGEHEMIQPFAFHLPTKITWQTPVSEALPEVVTSFDAHRALIVTDPGLVAAGLIERVQASLEASGTAVSVFADVGSNPTTDHVALVQQMASDTQADVLVAIGGGSPIDTAKAAAMLLANGGSYSDYQWSGRPIANRSHPLVTVPTTAGTGSEVTKVAVISDTDEPFKKGVLSPLMYARVAVLDPEVTVGLPAGLTAATGIDAFIHALEAFTGKRTNPVSDLLAIESLRLCWEYLPRATNNGSDLEARSQMMLAALFGGIAMDQAGLGLVHAISGGICSHLHLHHGLANASLLPTVFGFNVDHIAADRRASLATILGLPDDTDHEAITATITWFVDSIGLPTDLSAHGEALDSEAIDSIAEESMRMVMVHNNPRTVDIDDCRSLLEAMK